MQSNQSLKTQQVALLRFEQLLTRSAELIKKTGKTDRVALAAGLAALAPAVAYSKDVLDSDSLGSFHAAGEKLMNDASVSDVDLVVGLAEHAGNAHALAQKLAEAANVGLMQLGGGPKRPPPVQVMEILQSIPGL